MVGHSNISVDGHNSIVVAVVDGGGVARNAQTMGHSAGYLAASWEAGLLGSKTGMKTMSTNDLVERITNARNYSRRIPDPSMSNYKMVLASWKKLLDEMLELMELMATHSHVVIAETAPPVEAPPAEEKQ